MNDLTKAAICFMICLTLITIVVLLVTNDWTYSIKFEMDNNTLEAIKSMNWTTIQNMSK